MRILQLEADLRRKKEEARTLLEDTMRRCQEHVAQPATGDQPAILGREMTADERGAIDALLAEARGIRGQLDRAQGDADLRANIDRLTEGLASQPTPQPGAPARRRDGGAALARAAVRRR